MTALEYLETVQRLCEKTGAKGTPATQPSKRVEVVTKPTGIKPPLHALIIGINKYKHNVHLAAAAQDAQAFKSYLTDYLFVPESQITIMIDEQATRASIIKALQDLAKPDNGIEYGDPIVIYYAGYGSEIDPPPDMAANGQLVKCIVPQDASKADGIAPIPEFTVGALVHWTAHYKGNNITLIFDCCHSASGSRSTLEGARFVDKADLPTLSAKTDHDTIYDAQGGLRCYIEPYSWQLSSESMNSHVMLAACGYGEFAFEDREQGHGNFTNALLKLLRNVQLDTLTYKACMQRMPLLSRQPQHPICEGKNILNPFFNAMVSSTSTSFIPIKPDESNEFYLQAGLAQGITPRSRFTIHKANIISPKNIPIGTVEVDKVDTFVAHLKIANTLNLPTICYGRQVGGPERALDIYVTEEFVDAAEPSEAWAEVFSGDEEQLVLRPVERDIATVVLSVNAEKQATFTLNHPACVRYGIQTLPAPCFSPIPPSCSRVISVLTALLQWNWHLCRVPDSRPFQKDIDLEFYKLQVTDYSADGSPILTPNSPNLNEHGEFSFVASLDDYYGLRIINRSTQDLYADLFIFSPSTLAIDQKSIPIVDPALLHPIIPKNGHLTIGYGSELEIPFMFQVDPTMGYDITILKLFVSSAPVNFQSLEQSSPFEGGRSLISSNKVQDPINKKDLWDAFTITLIQKQDPKEKE